MKRILFISFLLISSVGFSQDFVSINFGPTYAKFDYKNQYGNSDPNLKANTGSGYAVNYKKCYKNGFFLCPELGYKNFSSVSILNTVPLAWSLNYIDFNIGAGYIYTKTIIEPFVGIALYGAYLNKAQQTIGNNNYDMISTNAIKNYDFGVNGFGGITFPFSEIASFYLEVAYTQGLVQLETYTNNQKLYNTAISFRLGIQFQIGKKSAIPATPATSDNK